MQSCRQDRRIVSQEDIAGAQILWQIGEEPVFQRARRAIDDEQTRLIAACGGSLRDQPRWQRVVEKFGSERRQKRRRARFAALALEPTIGFEPMTHALRKRCSTN